MPLRDDVVRVGGKYRLGKRIGSGSFGVSYAHHFNCYHSESTQELSTSGLILCQGKKLPSNSNL
jgi:hypothetical protein